jgi:preprotein translocase subunit SecF
MGDHDRDREPIRESERTTIVQTGGGGGGGGVIVAIVLILAVLALLFLFFGGNLNKAADKVGVNVNVDAPKIQLPDVNVKIPEKIEIPNVKVETEKTAEGNKVR